ncbi:MAG: bifunctional riboflavin kinase/FAD synthetase [Methylococcales bacterium]
MHVIRGLINLPKLEQGCALTIGNFDGVHRGHQAVISKLAEKARELNLPVVVMLFEPQPIEYFRPETTPARLSRLRDKVMLLQTLPVNYLLILRFNHALSRLSSAEFVRKILADGLNTKYLVVGDDFRFGYQRSGDYELLKSLAARFGFTVENTGSHSIDGERVSSTLIRDALAAGDLDRAKRFLGRPFSINGKVIQGNQNGRAIGFPTANIAILHKNPPVRGVFAVTMTRFRNREWAGVANVGVRPTFGGRSVFFLEVHLFDFESNLYGSFVEVHFHEKIRDEIRFGSVGELQQRIRQDVVAAREILGRRFGMTDHLIDSERPRF